LRMASRVARPRSPSSSCAATRLDRSSTSSTSHATWCKTTSGCLRQDRSVEPLRARRATAGWSARLIAQESFGVGGGLELRSGDVHRVRLRPLNRSFAGRRMPPVRPVAPRDAMLCDVR
jgi:hypothetical protein